MKKDANTRFYQLFMSAKLRRQATGYLMVPTYYNILLRNWLDEAFKLIQDPV